LAHPILKETKTDMNETVSSILIALVPALVVSVVTAYLTVRWSARQFHSQKWWELKAKAYSQIIAQLVNLQYCIERTVEMLSEEGDDFDFETREDLNKEYYRAKRYLRKETASGAYIISDEAAVALESLMEDLDNRESSITLWIQKQYDAVRHCVVRMRKYARADLHRR
jgi:hypothetical protein